MPNDGAIPGEVASTIAPVSPSSAGVPQLATAVDSPVNLAAQQAAPRAVAAIPAATSSFGVTGGSTTIAGVLVWLSHKYFKQDMSVEESLVYAGALSSLFTAGFRMVQSLFKQWASKHGYVIQ